MLIQCPNPLCLHPENPLGGRLCDRCQTPLVYRYLWAVEAEATQKPTGSLIADRYTVISPSIWLDTKPGTSPDIPQPLPDEALPYLRLYPQRLHVPDVYGVASVEESSSVLLLDNAAIDSSGQPFPGLETLWTKVSPVRQIYWLWQLLQLWTPLQAEGVATSLLVADNLRVEGWRVRLQALIADAPTLQGNSGNATESATVTQPPDPGELEDSSSSAQRQHPSLTHLAEIWIPWVKLTTGAIAPKLRVICQQMQAAEPADRVMQTVSTLLNRLLLEQSAQAPLHLKITGMTTTGPQRSHNEDACYPLKSGTSSKPDPEDPLLPHLGIICDGIGGHAGGEVASQLALRSLQLQLHALLTETTDQPEITDPDVVMQQLESLIRVVNNMIATQNDEQGREARQRMGTTLLLALQLPQQVPTSSGEGNSHELYLVSVGDSRAYWITPRYCHQLTIDDDVAVREVRLGRSLYYESQQRPDAGALTQALGTRDADTIYPQVQRFLLEEEGVLLLCSDGLSDNNLVERSWEDITRPFFKAKISLETLAQQWIDLANQQNGHDNTSIVMMHCRLAQEEPQLFDPTIPPAEATTPDSSLSAASRALLYDDESGAGAASTTDQRPVQRSPRVLAQAIGLVVAVSLLTGLSLILWRQLAPAHFNQTWERLFPAQSQ